MKKYRLYLCLILAGFSLQAIAQIHVKGINHVALAVENIEVSRQFYGHTIGLEAIEVPDELKAIRAWFRLGAGQELHLLAGRKKDVYHDKNGSHFSITIANADDVEAYLKLQAIPYERQQRFDGIWQIFIKDPDGYVLEFNEAKP